MTINLHKGQRISLAKTAPKLRRATLGLAWAPIESTGLLARFLGGLSEGVDLDASCVCLDVKGALVDAVWFRKLVSDDEAITHSGDNRTGDGDGDDETLTIELDRLNPKISSVILTINSFSRQSFERVKASSCRLMNSESGEELVRFSLDATGKHTALLMAGLLRSGDGWEMAAIGETGHGQTYNDLLPAIANWLTDRQGVQHDR